MRKDASKGVFITFEGGDGVGKTTQVELAAAWLRAQGCEVCQVHEPGGTELGEKIRALLLGRENEGMDPVAELLLYEAARAQVVSEVIRPALAAGKVVVCDRFTDSTVAYQGYGRELGAGLVQEVNAIATCGLEPDCTILLELDPELSMKRVLARSEDGAGDRMESAGASFHARVHEAFARLAAKGGDARVRVVDAGRAPEEVHADICEAVVGLLQAGPLAGGEGQ